MPKLSLYHQCNFCLKICLGNTQFLFHHQWRSIVNHFFHPFLILCTNGPQKYELIGKSLTRETGIHFLPFHSVHSLIILWNYLWKSHKSSRYFISTHFMAIQSYIYNSAIWLQLRLSQSIVSKPIKNCWPHLMKNNLLNLQITGSLFLDIFYHNIIRFFPRNLALMKRYLHFCELQKIKGLLTSDR